MNVRLRNERKKEQAMNKQNTIDFIDDLLADYSLYFDALCQEDVAQNVIKAIKDSSKGDD